MNGLNESDVKIVPFPASKVPELLSSGAIDAGQTWEPYQSQALAAGYQLLSSTADVHEMGDEKWAKERAHMVETQVRARGIRHEGVLASLGRVPRHEFVGEVQRDQAYHDHPLPIGHGQTISQPYMVAVMTEALQPHAGDDVLEVGTGSGYQAAVLAGLVAAVTSVEWVPELAERARLTLDRLGVDKVRVCHL